MKIGINRRDIQLPHLVNTYLIVYIYDKTLQQDQFLPTPCEEHIVVDGAGNGGNFGSTPNQPDQVGQGNGFRCQNGIAVALEEIVQTIQSEFKIVALGKAAAGKKQSICPLPGGINSNVSGNEIEDFQIFRREKLHAPKGDFRNNDFPVCSGCVDDFQLVPDFQELEKLPVVPLDLPFLIFVQKAYVLINGCIILQNVPQPGNGFHKEVPPVVYQIPAVNYLLVPINRFFKIITVPDAGGDSGQLHILSLSVNHTAPSEQQPLVGDLPQRQDGGIAASPDG